MDILLAVKPQFVQCMREGIKRVELRKRITMRAISRIFIYESSPVKRITGLFHPVEIEKLPVPILWKKTKSLSCISKSDFDVYFEGKPDGVAIWFDAFISFEPLPVTSVSASAPQSYMTLTPAQTAALEQLTGLIQPDEVF